MAKRTTTTWTGLLRNCRSPFRRQGRSRDLSLALRRTLRRQGRQENPKARALTRLRLNVDVAAVMPDDSIYRRETEARSLALLLSGVERLGQVTSYSTVRS